MANSPKATQRLLTAVAVLVVVAFAASTASAGTLDTVRERGKLVCGVNEGLAGFSIADAAGKWTGFDVDFCRAVAAAIFGNADRIEFAPLSTSERFEALKSGKIDILSRNSTWTMSRETDLDLTFVGVTYYDGQGFLVPRAAGVSSALELTGSKVCVQSGTTSESNVADYFAVNNMKLDAVLTTSHAGSLAAYRDGRCGVVTSDVSQLYAERSRLADPAEHVILADVISKEPLGPSVRQDDPKWATLVKWVHFALLNAEELGVGSATIDDALASTKPDVRRLLGIEGALGAQMGLTNDWVVTMMRSVGNYGEIYERNVGADSELGIPRGLNHLWSRGGIQYAPPMR
jgi:general L-amino acid transport system substrate-binding protein